MPGILDSLRGNTHVRYNPKTQKQVRVFPEKGAVRRDKKLLEKVQKLSFTQAQDLQDLSRVLAKEYEAIVHREGKAWAKEMEGLGFDQCFVLGLSDFHLDKELLEKQWLLFGDATPDDVHYHVDNCVFMRHDDGTTSLYRCTHVRDYREIKRWCKNHLAADFYMKVSHVWIDPKKNEAFMTREFFAWNNRFKKFTNITLDYTNRSDIKVVEDHIPQYALGQEFTNRFFWHISVAYEKGAASIMFPVRPEIIKTLFEDRDKNKKTGRKDALKHLVTSHWRGSPIAEDLFIFINKYLRGKLVFDWHGLIIKIHPSNDLLNEIEEAKLEKKRYVLSPKGRPVHKEE